MLFITFSYYKQSDINELNKCFYEIVWYEIDF